VQYAQILFKQGERLPILLSSYIKSAHGSFRFIYMPKTTGQGFPNQGKVCVLFGLQSPDCISGGTIHSH